MESNIDLDAIETKILEGDYPSWDSVLSIIDELRECQKGKKMGKHLPTSLGAFEFVKSTSRFHVYSRENEDGVRESIYVYKSHFDSGEKPAKIEFFMKY